MNSQASLFPLPMAGFGFIPNEVADEKLAEWGHWLGGCSRPFGVQSFGLEVRGVGLVSVAVSASTVNAKCGPYKRKECVELARCASHPDHRWATRVCLRLWREIAPGCWEDAFWPVKGLVSYSNNARHTGGIYRFDGWKRFGKVPGGKAGGGWQRGKKYEAKTGVVLAGERRSTR